MEEEMSSLQAVHVHTNAADGEKKRVLTFREVSFSFVL